MLTKIIWNLSAYHLYTEIYHSYRKLSSLLKKRTKLDFQLQDRVGEDTIIYQTELGIYRYEGVLKDV